jgi:hypothetical protein
VPGRKLAAPVAQDPAVQQRAQQTIHEANKEPMNAAERRAIRVGNDNQSDFDIYVLRKGWARIRAAVPSAGAPSAGAGRNDTDTLAT